MLLSICSSDAPRHASGRTGFAERKCSTKKTLVTVLVSTPSAREQAPFFSGLHVSVQPPEPRRARPNLTLQHAMLHARVSFGFRERLVSCPIPQRP